MSTAYLWWFRRSCEFFEQIRKHSFDTFGCMVQYVINDGYDFNPMKDGLCREIIHPYALAVIISICILSTNYVLFSGGMPANSSIVYIGVGMDAISVTFCSILFVSLAMNRSSVGNDARFMTIIMLECVVLALNSASWFVNGNPDLAIWNKLFRYAKNIMLIFVWVVLWDFLTSYLDIDSRRRRCFWVIMVAVMIAAIMLVFSDILDNTVFLVNSSGYYNRSVNIILLYIIGLFPPLLSTYCVLRYHSGARERFVSVSFLLVTVIMEILQYYNNGISLIYKVPAITIVIIYANFYIMENNRQIRYEADVKKERYDSMITQIQPHFLYNSLTSIVSMEGVSAEAKDAIIDFATYLRENLSAVERSNPVPFRKEVSHVELYLEMEKRRFKDRLNYVFDIRDDAFPIPPLSLQMVVENAVRHGITMKRDGGTITISSMEVEGGHLVVVEDDGIGFDDSVPLEYGHSNGGLVLSRRRLAEEVSGHLAVTSRVGVGTRAEIFIPFQAIVKDE